MLLATVVENLQLVHNKQICISVRKPTVEDTFNITRQNDTEKALASELVFSCYTTTSYSTSLEITCKRPDLTAPQAKFCGPLWPYDCVVSALQSFALRAINIWQVSWPGQLCSGFYNQEAEWTWNSDVEFTIWDSFLSNG